MRLIDADKLIDDIKINSESYFADDFAFIWVNKQPTIKTNQIKYYDEDEQVWKMGEVIVNSSEKPNNSTTEDCSD